MRTQLNPEGKNKQPMSRSVGWIFHACFRKCNDTVPDEFKLEKLTKAKFELKCERNFFVKQLNEIYFDILKFVTDREPQQNNIFFYKNYILFIE